MVASTPLSKSAGLIFMCKFSSRLLTLQICFEIGERGDFTAHRLSNHGTHKPGQAFRFIMQGKGQAGGVSNPFKSILPGGPCRSADHMKCDQGVRLALDDLVVALDEPPSRPFQSLFGGSELMPNKQAKMGR